MLISLLSD